MPFRSKSRGVWRGQVKYEGKTYQATFQTRREAANWELVKRKELEAAAATQTPTGTALLDFFNQYLDHSELRYTRKVFKEKKALCEELTVRWGGILAEDVTPEMVNAYLHEIARSKSTNRHNKDRKNLLAMWNWGIKILDLPGNPVAKIEKLPHDRAPQYTPPTADILKVLAAANREERIFLNCYLQTGARRSEIFRWTWAEDINFEKREVRLGTRKTRDSSMSYEWLPMNEELYRELWSWWQNRPIKDSPYVFVSTSNRHHGNPFTSRRQFMKHLCKRAGVKEFGFHALRRYVASLLADTHKISAKTIQRILRHKNVTTTERYIQNINRDLGAVMDLLSEKGCHEGLSNNSKGLGNEP
ncbi:MAG: tyrosine-type recombinase/integrase [Desulfomonilaceae bacterium]